MNNVLNKVKNCSVTSVAEFVKKINIKFNQINKKGITA